MSLYLQWNDTSGATRTIYFDIAHTVGIELTNSITDHPVEKGANITDHSRALPTEVTMEVMITNAPIRDFADGSREATVSGVPVDFVTKVPPTRVPGIVAISRGLQTYEIKQPMQTFRNADFVQETFDALADLQENAQILKVATDYRLFDSMLIQQISIQDTEDTGDDATFRIHLKRVRIVESVTVPVPLYPEAKKPVSTGKKDTKDSEHETTKSVGQAILDGLPDGAKDSIKSYTGFSL